MAAMLVNPSLHALRDMVNSASWKKANPPDDANAAFPADAVPLSETLAEKKAGDVQRPCQKAPPGP